MVQELRIERERTALLVIDMQNDLVKDEAGPFSLLVRQVKEGRVIENIARILEAARGAGIPVFHIRLIHRRDGSDIWRGWIADFMSLLPPDILEAMSKRLVEGTPGADFVPELKPWDNEYVVQKRRMDAFFGTDLEILLRRLGVETLIITGVATSMCVLATAIGAFERDFNLIFASDGCADFDPQVNEFMIRNVFPRRGRVRSSEEIANALKG